MTTTNALMEPDGENQEFETAFAAYNQSYESELTKFRTLLSKVGSLLKRK